MTQLTSLDLNGNDLGAAGAASLAPALSTITQLTSPQLWNNDLGAAGRRFGEEIALATQSVQLELACLKPFIDQNSIQTRDTAVGSLNGAHRNWTYKKVIGY